MIDVIFLLLIFYMVAGSIVRDDVENVLPPVAIIEDENILSTGALIVGEDGKTYSQNEEVAVDVWLAAREKAGLSQQPLKLAADAELKADKLEKVLKTLSDEGENNVTLITRKNVR